MLSRYLMAAQVTHNKTLGLTITHNAPNKNTTPVHRNRVCITKQHLLILIKHRVTHNR